MKHQVNLDSCVGKVITGIGWDYCNHAVAITFTDQTFACLTARPSFDDAELVDAAYEWRDFSHLEAIRLGIITPEEIDELENNHAAKERSRRDKLDRELYEQLKRRFGVNPQ
jgi:hypothetical protein